MSPPAITRFHHWCALTAGIVGASTLLAACGSSSPAVCPNDLPPSCVSPTPSYANQVSQIIQASCVSCHQPGGVAANRPLGTYAQVAALRGNVLDQVYGCRMPPSDQKPLTTAERQALLQWLVCKAPEN